MVVVVVGLYEKFSIFMVKVCVFCSTQNGHGYIYINFIERNVYIFKVKERDRDTMCSSN